MNRVLSAALVILLGGGAAQAALFSGPAGFTTVPWSQIGTVTNNLTITDTANGFIVAGQVLISVPPGGPNGGILAAWVVDRPLDPTYGTSLLSTTTLLDGYSAPPPGVIQTTAGWTFSEITSFPGPSNSFIPITLTNGAATWNNVTVNSITFPYVSGGTEFLRQVFELDGSQLNGPGGTWTIDVPVETSINIVPEPSTLLLAGMGGLLAGFGYWRRRRR